MDLRIANQSLGLPVPLQLVEVTKAVHLGVVTAEVMEEGLEEDLVATEGPLPPAVDVKSLSTTFVLPQSHIYLDQAQNHLNLLYSCPTRLVGKTSRTCSVKLVGIPF